jgi:hypothetical protein
MDVVDPYLTFVPSSLEPQQFRSHMMLVAPQHTLTCGERDVLAFSNATTLAGRTQTRDEPHPGRPQTSKPLGMGRRRDVRRLFQSFRVMGSKTAQVSLVRPGFHVVEHAAWKVWRKKYDHLPSARSTHPQAV